jgi:2,3,4,5-tetrahydropyridine-2-carboxylate N-succinyltransferase
MSPAPLQTEIERLFDHKPSAYTEGHFRLFYEFKDALNQGRIRAAQPDPSTPSGWRVNRWVKKGILLGFRMGGVVDMAIDATRQPYLDKSTYPVKQFSVENGVRIVPGGSSIRDGVYIGKGVTCMPPMYINVGAYVDEGTMVDSHALVGRRRADRRQLRRLRGSGSQETRGARDGHHTQPLHASLRPGSRRRPQSHR